MSKIVKIISNIVYATGILVFLPDFICAACTIIIIGVIVFGMINSFIFDGILTR